MHKIVQFFDSGRAKNPATSELSSVYRLLHAVVVHNITPRSEGKATVKCRGMVLMHYLHSGKAINLPLQILIAIHESRFVKQGLVHGHVITKLLEKEGVNLDAYSMRRPDSCTIFGIDLLHKMGLDVDGRMVVYKEDKPKTKAKQPIREERKIEPDVSEDRDVISEHPAP